MCVVGGGVGGGEVIEPYKQEGWVLAFKILFLPHICKLPLYCVFLALAYPVKNEETLSFWSIFKL